MVHWSVVVVAMPQANSFSRQRRIAVPDDTNGNSQGFQGLVITQVYDELILSALISARPSFHGGCARWKGSQPSLPKRGLCVNLPSLWPTPIPNSIFKSSSPSKDGRT